MRVISNSTDTSDNTFAEDDTLQSIELAGYTRYVLKSTAAGFIKYVKYKLQQSLWTKQISKEWVS